MRKIAFTSRQVLLLLVLPPAGASFYHSGGDVTILASKKDWKTEVKMSNFMWVVQFYREYCGEQSMGNAEFSKAATKLKPYVRLGAVEVDQSKELADLIAKKFKFSLEGLQNKCQSKVRLFNPDPIAKLKERWQGKKVHFDYPGLLNAKEIAKWAMPQVPSFLRPFGDVSGGADCRCSASMKICPCDQVKRNEKVSYIYSEHDCGPTKSILFTEKNNVSATAKALSSEYRDRIDIAHVTAEQYPELAEQFNIGKPPALVVLKGVRNDEAWSKKFKGKAFAVFDGKTHSFRSIDTWLSKFGTPVLCKSETGRPELAAPQDSGQAHLPSGTRVPPDWMLEKAGWTAEQIAAAKGEKVRGRLQNSEL